MDFDIENSRSLRPIDPEAIKGLVVDARFITGTPDGKDQYYNMKCTYSELVGTKNGWDYDALYMYAYTGFNKNDRTFITLKVLRSSINPASDGYLKSEHQVVEVKRIGPLLKYCPNQDQKWF